MKFFESTGLVAQYAPTALVVLGVATVVILVGRYWQAARMLSDDADGENGTAEQRPEAGRSNMILTATVVGVFVLLAWQLVESKMTDARAAKDDDARAQALYSRCLQDADAGLVARSRCDAFFEEAH